MKNCINCGFDNEEEDKYCRRCGCVIKNNSYIIICKVISISLIILTFILLIILIFTLLIN